MHYIQLILLSKYKFEKWKLLWYINESTKDKEYFKCLKNESDVELEKRYKKVEDYELETVVNVIYDENILSIYTNKPDLERKLNQIVGEPTKEYKIKRSIAGSTWEIPLTDKSKIAKVILKVDLFECL